MILASDRAASLCLNLRRHFSDFFREIRRFRETRRKVCAQEVRASAVPRDM
jgi:hypothetical protein